MTLDHERSTHLRALADRLPSAVVVVGIDGTVLLWNKAAEQVFAMNDEQRGASLESLLQRARTSGPTTMPEPDSLTSRQREVLQLIAEGEPTRDIAKKLKLSVKTIETHRAHLMQRLQVDSVAKLVRYAVSTGLVPPTP